MAVINCPPNVWTDIPNIGLDCIIEAREKGLYVDTAGTIAEADAAAGFALPGMQSMVVQAALLANPVRVMPSNPLKAASVRYNPV